MRERWMAALVALAASALVAAVIAVHPAWTVPFDARPLLAFDGARVPAFLRSLAVLAGLNLAAWAAGTAVHRLLGGHVASPLDALTRLALGLLALSDLVLALAALHQLRRGVLLVLLLWLAAAGLALLVRRWPRGAIPRVPL
ncbi:MAG TPA: hypothetical protein VFO85_06870, partial [Vicinamibacteria bacterium]|nr:hypothetical protein [Vicinamibacteria bacterium]